MTLGAPATWNIDSKFQAWKCRLVIHVVMHGSILVLIMASIDECAGHIISVGQLFSVNLQFCTELQMFAIVQSR